MMHGHEKSPSAIVAVKLTNKAERSAAEQSAAEPTAAESVERRAETKGNVDQQRTRRTQESHKRVKDAGSHKAANSCRGYPRREPYAGKPHVRICAGGAR